MQDAAAWPRCAPCRPPPVGTAQTIGKAMKTQTPKAPTSPRVQRVIARLRRKQLDLAMAGNMSDSAKYAQRAWKVRLFGRKVA